MVNAILAKRVNHIVTKGDNPAWPKGSKSRGFSRFVEDDNIRSKRLCERLGMRREGCFKEFVTFVNNPDGSPKYEDTCVYAILEKEWNTIRQW